MIIKDKKKRIILKYLVVFLVFLFIFLISLENTSAGEATKIIDKAVDSTGFVSGFFLDIMLIVVYFVLYVIYLFVSIIMIGAGILFDWAINPSNFYAVMQLDAIYQAWTIVRDFLNLAFILVLLFSAFATIFQVEKFHLKKILLTLVIMALLVNFSFPVARFIVDTANVTMYFILGKAFPDLNNDTGLATSILQFSNVADIIAPFSNNQQGSMITTPPVSEFDTSPSTATLYLLGAIVYVFLFGITIMVIAVLLVIRIVVLAVLVIFSPVGFVASILPSTKNFANSWWDNLFKQAFFGPIMAFMLYLSLMLFANIQRDSIKVVESGQLAGNEFSRIIVAFGNLAIPMVILWTGLIAAQKLGAAGSSVVIGKAGGIAKWPARMLGKAIKYGVKSGLKKFERDVLIEPRLKKGKMPLSPRAWVEGWKQRAEEIDKDIISKGAGKTRDKLNKFFEKSETDYEDQARSKIVAREEKNYRDRGLTDVDRLGPEMTRLTGSKENLASEKLEAAYRIAAASRDPDEVLGHFADNIRKKLGNGKEVKDLGIDRLVDLDTGQTVKGNITHEDLGRHSNWNINQLFKAMMTETGVDDKRIMKAMRDISNITSPVGGIFNFGAAFNSKTGKMEYTTPKQMAYLSARKRETIAEAQRLAQITHRNQATDEYIDPSGSTDPHLNLERREAFLKVNPSNIEHVGRTQPNFAKQVGGDPKIADEQFKFLQKMYAGTAEFWDPKIGDVDSYINITGDKKECENQAYIAAALVAAEMSRAGVDVATIRNKLFSAGFVDTSKLKSIYGQSRIIPDSVIGP